MSWGIVEYRYECDRCERPEPTWTQDLVDERERGWFFGEDGACLCPKHNLREHRPTVIE